jgi:hypothetical protein
MMVDFGSRRNERSRKFGGEKSLIIPMYRKERMRVCVCVCARRKRYTRKGVSESRKLWIE